jgi:hypothetical protein
VGKPNVYLSTDIRFIEWVKGKAILGKALRVLGG